MFDEGNPLGPPQANPLAIPGVTLYELPQPGRRYVIGADPAEGNPNSDESAACVLDDAAGLDVGGCHDVLGFVACGGRQRVGHRLGRAHHVAGALFAAGEDLGVGGVELAVPELDGVLRLPQHLVVRHRAPG